MVDRKISRKLKGKVLDSCVVPGSNHGFDTLALTEQHQHKLQVCENNWTRRIAGVRRVDRRRMKDMREEVGTKACVVGKIVKSRMKWAGLMVRMKDDRLPKRSETKKQEGFRKRGRPQLIWGGGLCKQISEKYRGGRKVERKGQQQRPMEANYESICTSEWPGDQPHPYTREPEEEQEHDLSGTVVLF